MPAVELPKLRARLDLLLRSGSDPMELARGIRALFELYSDPTQPVTAQLAAAKSVRFNTPLILSLEVEKALQPACQEKPLEILPLIDAFWLFPEIELRQLASALLGRISTDLSVEVLSRIDRWTNQELEGELLQFLLKTATIKLRKNDPDTWLALLKTWGKSDNPQRVSMAIQGLHPLIEDKDFPNLPLIYTYLYPFFLPFRSDHVYDLETTVVELAWRSEIETVYFLKQVMGGDQERTYGRFIRRILDQFSPTNQESLKNALKEHPNLR